MRRLDKRTVELDDLEIQARREHGILLDEGFSTLQATAGIWDSYGERLSAEFYLYLSDGVPLPHMI